MLTFEQKLAIIESFPELERKNVSLGRVNFQYEESAFDKKNVVYHLHPNGNGFVYAELAEGYQTDDKGLVNIRDFDESELRTIIADAIKSLAPRSNEEAAIIGDAPQELWINSENQTLILIEEDDLWNTYAGLNLDGTFPSYNEAVQYLEEEGFKRR
ncbi:hypothetical protein CVD25_14625 [Bacillus canaveralius]|uniref:Uncharacterized protein n=1 Tax=Bacillus canaveralius TaxID=1403243 RepID=A0A2N5GHT0_9BACI|nr:MULTISPECIES: hypothetical protein [Bacillus]PLR80328.1 hypothetical protein CU635_18610 [Bacillus canaveralius]PLR85812.1 hypothetical protein CVD23_07705 [Bacillus sp. V33-4]PLR95453.1 hypothetical protein CVD25_14625 [Bacillus canaveralius]RSK48695.1 hypothetical protein EJA13_16355 [Bacillus canaveralius]